MTRRQNLTTSEPPAPVDDWGSVMAVTRANAANGFPWDMPLVLVVYGLLRAIAAICGALLGPRPR